VDILRFYRPFVMYFRPRRMRAFCEQFGITDDTRILDVGGTPLNWNLVSVKPQLTLLNIHLPSPRHTAQLAPHMTWLVGDGTRLPYKDGAFDIVFSNSVIEHLGSLDNQRQFAAETTRVGTRYYVQTPNRRFFFEPHLLTPFVHFLPRRWRRRLLCNFTVWGLIARPTDEQVEGFLDEVRLLDAGEMAALFPGGLLKRERFLGMVKSLTASNVTHQPEKYNT
jgi:hypothetical protein